MNISSGYLKIIGATLIFSFAPIVVKLIQLDAISLLWTINVAGVGFLLLRLVQKGRIRELLRPGKAVIVILALGLVFTINNALFLSAIKATTIANAMFTHYLAPFFLIFLGAFFLKEKIEKISVVAIFISLVGLFILLSSNELNLSNAHFLGILLGTLSAIFFAIEIAFKKHLSTFLKPDIITVWYVLLSVLFLLPFVSFSSIGGLDGGALLILFVSGIFIVTIGITLFISGLREVKIQHVGILSYIEQLGAIVWGSLLISEALPLTTLIGGALAGLLERY